MLEAVDAFVDFEVNPPTVCEACEVVFVDEFLRDVGKFDSDIFWSVERCAKVEVFDVEAGKAGVWRGDDAVNEQFG